MDFEVVTLYSRHSLVPKALCSIHIIEFFIHCNYIQIDGSFIFAERIHQKFLFVATQEIEHVPARQGSRGMALLVTTLMNVLMVAMEDAMLKQIVQIHMAQGFAHAK